MVEHRLLLVTMSFAVLALSIVEATLSSNDSDVTPAPLSGCQVCAASGDCSHAYLDAPGQFCGNWLDRASQRQRCCCPREATCAVSNYACNCKTSRTKTPTSASTRTSTSSSSRASWGAILGSVLLLFAASAVLWCLCPCCRANKYAALSQSMTPVVVQAPAYAPTYAHTYTPGYASGPVYGGPAYSNGGMGAGSSAMLGGVAGLFGGILVGQALSNSGEHHGGSDACYTDNGGEEFGGDF